MTAHRRDRAVVLRARPSSPPTGLVAVLVVASLLGSARPSLAIGTDPSAPVDDAASHFHHGVSLYKDADYAGALVEFRRAQELSPNYRVLYNVGQSLYELQRYAEALTAFEDYLTQGGAQISAARRAGVEADLRALRARVGYVTVEVNVEGAEVRVDDETIGTSPISAPILVSIGHRKITVVKPDRPPMERFVDVAVGDRAKVAFDFPSAVTAAPAPPPEATLPPPPAKEPSASAPLPAPPPEPPPTPTSSLTWIPWAATGILAVGTAVTGVLTLTSKTSLSNDLATFPGNPSAIAQDRSRANTFAVASDVLLGASAVALGVSLYVTLRPHRTGAGDTRGGVRVGFGLDGVRLQGDF